MKYNISFENTLTDNSSTSSYNNINILVKDLNYYNKMFESGIRINKGDIINLMELEDYLNGYYGDLEKKATEKWCGDLDSALYVRCSYVEFKPRFDEGCIDVNVGLSD